MKENITSQNQGKKFIKQNTSVNILGTEYKILYRDYSSETEFKNGAAGYCNMMLKEIHICNIESYPDVPQLSDIEKGITYKAVLRHEIVHAFLFESGLDNESHSPNAWALSEEIVDWIAIQAPKFNKIFNELGIMD